MTTRKPSPELLAIFGFIDAEEYLRLTDTVSPKSHRFTPEQKAKVSRGMREYHARRKERLQ